MILFANYLVKSRNHRTVYLGQNIPFRDLRPVVEKTNPDYLLTSFTIHPSAENTPGYINLLSSEFPDKKMVISGQRLSSVYMNLPSNMKKVEDFSELTELLATV